MKPLLVGEANPYGGDPAFALYPDPPGCAGHRLCHKVMGLDPGAYLERFDRVNLCPRAWSAPVARERARSLTNEAAANDRSAVVMLGAKVLKAFRDANAWSGPFALFGVYELPVLYGRPKYVVLPHPSGLCREWSKPGAFERARATLREVGVLT